jgi:Flp pilus assembly protein TadD
MVEQRQAGLDLFEQAVALEDDAEGQKRLYLQALEADPSMGKAWNNLGLIYLDEGSYGEAVRMLREACKRMPGSAAPRFNLGYTYELIGRLADAEEQYRVAVELAPEDPDYLESLARMHLRRRDYLVEAEELLRRALHFETRPEHVEWINHQLDSLRHGYIP